MRNYKFSAEINTAFASALKKRVNDHFSTGEISKNANREMVIKTISAISLYLIPYAITVILRPSSIPLLFALWAIMGFAKAFIGTSVMHDALHGSYSKNKVFNKFTGVSALILGVDPLIWKLQHNVLHHTYTNIEDADEDIAPRFVLRFSPNQPLKWFHRYQHVYAVFFYSLLTLVWVLFKDYNKAIQYRKKGLLKDRSFPLFMAGILLKKAAYFAVFLVIPIYVLPVSTGVVIALFLVMHVIAGLLLSFIFQPAHVMESCEFVQPDEGEEVIKENWLAHQLRTTSNFGVKSSVLFWFGGGLNHQIEHHLFPNICHVHYRKISKIVKSTAVEYGLPYHTQSTYGAAIYNHLKMLRALGTGRL